MKLVVEESESAELERHLPDEVVRATSRLAVVEVPRAAKIANPAEELAHETQRMLSACMLVDVTDRVLRSAALLPRAR